MDDRCVSCGTYVPEGRMVCPNCETKAKEQTIKIKKMPLWRKIIAFFMGIVMCFTFAACSNQKVNEIEETTKIENAVVDIITSEGSYYSTFSDVEINYCKDEVSNIFIKNNAILAFSVSEHYDGGVYIVEGTDFEQIQSDISAAKQSLKDGNIDSAQKYLDKVSELTAQQPVYDYCPT